MARDISQRRRIEARDRFLVDLDDAVRPLTDAEEITLTAAKALGQHLGVNRCAYATVEDDEDTFVLTGNYNDGVQSIVGRYTFRQFGAECLRLMRAGSRTSSPTQSAIRASRTRNGPPTHDRHWRSSACRSSSRPVRGGDGGPYRDATNLAAGRGRARAAGGGPLLGIDRAARVTQKLKESEHLFRALANSIANLAWMARPDGWIYWYNDQWYAYTGTTPADMEGWGWERVHDPAMLPAVKERWQDVDRHGHAVRDGVSVARRRRTVPPLPDARQPGSRFRGEVVALVRHQHRCRKRASRHRSQRRPAGARAAGAPGGGAPEAAAALAVHAGADADRRPARARPRRRTRQPAGLPGVGPHRRELLNRPLFDVMPELRDQVFRSLLADVYRTGVPYVGNGNTRAVRTAAAGTTETVYFNFVYSPFRNIDGEIEGIFVIASDVTEQVLARNQVDALREAPRPPTARRTSSSRCSGTSFATRCPRSSPRCS